MAKPFKPYPYEDLEEVRWRWQVKNRGGFRRLNNYLILTKTPNCGRGEYAEELDVRATTPTDAKKIAQAVLDKEYETGLRIARVVWQGQA